ncbi:unnamed protein product [Aphanomyces euteiches]|uniref:Uncharacterized protein n=1 Tax=Aphanomyces euteiches TaxID=100861 RepID=A0A6G0W5F4_9STRA|nr:hypothetical protein Ae201684_018516 [Aphanomyces euteiches]KAH9075862.1 hypothetical protein Ae201684P_012355 [Aphanomyces euteiches]KAH9146077.1 hypothetical protein AeRB84_010020 [Aphanomyces euteiches]
MDRENGYVLDTNVLNGSNSLGLWITIVAGVCSNLGVQLQKHAHREQEAKENNAYFAKKQWIAGMALVILGSIGDFEALSFATQSLVTTVGGGTTVMTNVLLSTIWHGEQFSLRDAYGTSCVLLGVILIALCSPQDGEYNVEQLVDKFQSPTVVAYLIILGVTIGYLTWMIDSAVDNPKRQTAVSVRTSARIRRFLRIDEEDSWSKPLLYAIISGIMGSLSVLLGKCASEMVKTTVNGNNQFYHPMTYVFFGGMLTTIGLQIHWFNKALILGDISVVFPVFQVFWIGFGVIGGMVLYGDLARLEFFQGVSFVLASCCILVGVYNLAQHETSEKSSTSLDAARKKSIESDTYLIEAYQSLLESHESDRVVPTSENQNTYRPPAVLRSL